MWLTVCVQDAYLVLNLWEKEKHILYQLLFYNIPLKLFF